MNKEQKECPYCHSFTPSRYDNESEWGDEVMVDADYPITPLVINLSNKTLFIPCFTGIEFKISNCPMCGRKL
ncbi:MAG: hypothetical protein ABF750_09255 [Oenococcus oeni]